MQVAAENEETCHQRPEGDTIRVNYGHNHNHKFLQSQANNKDYSF